MYTVRQQIKKEFHLNEWIDLALGKNTETIIKPSQSTMVSTECQTETRGISASARAILAAKNQRSASVINSLSGISSRKPYEALSNSTSIYSLARRSTVNKTEQVKRAMETQNSSSETLHSAVGSVRTSKVIVPTKSRLNELRKVKEIQGIVTSSVENLQEASEPYEEAYVLPPFYQFKKIAKP
jgi:hypothetical protein